MEGPVEGFHRFREAFPARGDLFHKLAHVQSPHTKRHALDQSAAVCPLNVSNARSASCPKRLSDAAEGWSPPQQVKRTEPGWSGLIFAAKTTASALIALLIAFTFDLDQPQWALLTVFIVAQPQSGLVFAKSFYRIIGTLIGACVALLLVALFAQERVLFLGALALWIGLCTFGFEYARNFTAYSFILSGYTAVIVGIPGALDAGNAFYIATARVTEISLGIIVMATVSHIVPLNSVAASLTQAIADARKGLADYAIALFSASDAAPLRAKLLSQAIAVENLRASAMFEDRDIRGRSNALRLLDAAFLRVVGVAQLLARRLDAFGRADASTKAGLDDVMAEAAVAIKAWRAAAIDTAAFSRRLLRARARLPTVWQLCRDPSALDEEAIRRIALIARLRDFLAALTAYAEVYEVFVSGKRLAPRGIGFAHADDPMGALWTGLRTALAVFFVSGFWILANWSHGSTAATLVAAATARLATVGPAVPIAVARTLIFSISIIPAFVLIEILLPLASGFEMFALVVAPMLFSCALLMAHKRTHLIGFFSAQLFASAGLFQNRMDYDPVDLINTSIAALVVASVAMLLWAIFAPTTPEAARHRFLRAARKALTRIATPRPSTQLTEFETAMSEGLDDLRRHLRPDRPDDITVFEAGIALLNAGRELIRVRDRASSCATTARKLEIVKLVGCQRAQWSNRARRRAQKAAVSCLAELREDALGTKQAHAAACKIVAFTAIRDELECGGALPTGQRHEGARSDAA
jgi:uncharacterized membrane protein YccC